MSLISDLFAGGIEGVFSSLSGVIKTLKADPTIVSQQPVLIAQIEAAATHDMLALQSKLAEVDAKVLETVNATMQAESKSEHWLQWSWRPLGAYILYGLLIHNYVLASYFAKFGLTQVAIPMEVWYIFLALLGVSAYTRGQVQVEQVKKGS